MIFIINMFLCYVFFSKFVNIKIYYILESVQKKNIIFSKNYYTNKSQFHSLSYKLWNCYKAIGR